LEDAAPERIKWIPKHWYQKPRPIRKKKKQTKKPVQMVSQVIIERATDWSDEKIQREVQRDDLEFQWIIGLKEQYDEKPAWE
jgi:hypothetical protein